MKALSVCADMAEAVPLPSEAAPAAPAPAPAAGPARARASSDDDSDELRRRARDPPITFPDIDVSTPTITTWDLVPQ